MWSIWLRLLFSYSVLELNNKKKTKQEVNKLGNICECLKCIKEITKHKTKT